MAADRITRRHFLMGALASGATLSGCARLLGPDGSPIGQTAFIPPKDKLRVACVGVGGRGWADVQEMAATGHRIVALCDVDSVRAEKAYQAYPDVPKFVDYRKMFDKMDNQIDAVLVSTPDHTHAVITMEAIERGKHVMVQKPLTHNIAEVRALAKAAKRKGVVTQMCNQGHANEGPRLLCEWVWSGAVGAVREVHMWTDRPIWPQGMASRPAGQAVPSTLDWDLWLGPAEMREFSEEYVPFKWRGWRAFGTGALGDMGCHIFDSPFWALKLQEAPYVTITAEHAPITEEAWPEWSVITYEFPARGEMPPVKVVWYDGSKKPERPAELEAGRELGKQGQIWVCDKGKILMDYNGQSARMIPEEKMDLILDAEPREVHWRSPGAWQEFANACQGGPLPGSNFEYSAPLTEIVILGNFALNAEGPFHYDFTKGRVTDQVALNQFLEREYRKGWSL